MIHGAALATALVLNATANLMIRAGARAIAARHLEATAVPVLAALKAGLTNPWIIGGVVCFALNLAAYSYALTKLPVSMAYPIMVSVGYAIIVCGAAVWFSERLNVWQWVGVGVILAGVWLVASGMAKTA
jgi:multidrug transporter EmrE-like cation transporter